jgi:ribosomal protein L12E/L44/L45/RPP1/RPP2
MTNEEGKKVMFKIMFDLLFAEDTQDVLSVIAKHLELNEQDIEEVEDRFGGELRDAFMNTPGFSSSPLAKSLAEAEREKRRNRKRDTTEKEAKNIMLRIMLDLLFVKNIKGALTVTAKHLKLSEQDIDEVVDRFNEAMSDTFGNNPPEFVDPFLPKGGAENNSN